MVSLSMWVIWPFATSIPPLIIFAVVNGFCGELSFAPVLFGKTPPTYYLLVTSGRYVLVDPRSSLVDVRVSSIVNTPSTRQKSEFESSVR
jgi:hypothetical protein